MAAHGGPNIVDDGLVLHLDAENTQSYPGTGSTWYDLIGNLNVSTSTTSSLSSSGAIFDGTDDRIGYSSWPSDLNIDDNTTSRTWEVWIKPNSTTGSQAIFGHKAGIGCSLYCNGGLYIYNGKYTFNWYNNSSYQYLQSSVSVTTNPAHFVATFDGSDSKPRVYVNGKLEATYNTSTNLNYSSGMNIVEFGYGSKNGGLHWYNGIIYMAKFYKEKALSADEVQQNFSAKRGRYGL